MSLSLIKIYDIEGRKTAQWSHTSQKTLASLKIKLNQLIRLKCCTHVKNAGGIKASIRTVNKGMNIAKHMARFDIYHYYQSIDHHILLETLKSMGIDGQDLLTIQAYLTLPDTHHTGKGLMAGGTLSPILGAIYLYPLDQVIADLKKNQKITLYTRYMDDYMILAPSRWKLKKAIKKMHKILEALQLIIHPKKKFIGRTNTGCDFLGYTFKSGRKLRPSKESYKRLRIRARRLHEKGADHHQLLQYLNKWLIWIHGGLSRLVSRQGGIRKLEKYIVRFLERVVDGYP